MGLPLSTKISTPTGWVPIKDVNVGDAVHTGHGYVSTVKSVRFRAARTLYRVVSSDFYESLTADEQLVSTVQGFVPVLDLVDKTPVDISVIPEGLDYTLFYPEEFFDSTYLGYMLQEEDPIEGSVACYPNPDSDILDHLPYAPSFAFRDNRLIGYMTLYWREQEIDNFEHLTLFQEANLFSGRSKEFDIPNSYLFAPYEVRRDLAKTFLMDRFGNGKFDFDTNLKKMNYTKHPYHRKLKELFSSLGWLTHPGPRQIVSVELHSDSGENTKDIYLESEDQTYLLEGFIITKSEEEK